MNDYIELSSEFSMEDSSSDEEGYIPIEEFIEEPEKKEEAVVLAAKQIYEMMQSELKKVCDVTGKAPNEARRLLSLNEIKWDTEKLLEILFQGGQKAKTISETLKPEQSLEVPDTCPICCDKLGDQSVCLKLRCNHSICRDCFSGFVTFKIEKEAGLLVNAIQCPALKCEWELDEELVLDGLQTERLKARYLQIMTTNFVQTNKLLSWCPSANCNNAIKVYCMKSQDFRESVRCSCGCWFCFQCMALSHDPVPCSLLEDWAKVKQEDMEVKNWILNYTKQCPRCHVNIEKKGGCMHMTCTACKYEFCWLCFGNWRKHNCNPAAPRAVGSEGMQFVRRFTLYHEKHETMHQSYKLNVEQFKSMTSYGVELELPSQMVKVDFVAAAIELLLQCRRTLMYSYVFSYFMTTIDNQMFMFEENLKFLEQNTEALSEVLENNISAENWNSVKPIILDRHSKCEKQRRSLLDHIKEGYEKNWWRKFPIPLEELMAVERRVHDQAIQQLIY